MTAFQHTVPGSFPQNHPAASFAQHLPPSFTQPYLASSVPQQFPVSLAQLGIQSPTGRGSAMATLQQIRPGVSQITFGPQLGLQGQGAQGRPPVMSSQGVQGPAVPGLPHGKIHSILALDTLPLTRCNTELSEDDSL